MQLIIFALFLSVSSWQKPLVHTYTLLARMCLFTHVFQPCVQHAQHPMLISTYSDKCILMP